MPCLAGDAVAAGDAAGDAAGELDFFSAKVATGTQRRAARQTRLINSVLLFIILFLVEGGAPDPHELRGEFDFSSAGVAQSRFKKQQRCFVASEIADASLGKLGRTTILDNVRNFWRVRDSIGLCKS